MNDALADAQKARVLVVFERWGGPLGMGWQRKVSFRWYRGAVPDFPDAAMVCDASWQYKEAVIQVDLVKVADLEDDSLEFSLVHEIMHVYLRGLIEAHHEKVDREAFRMIEEHTASSLAQAVMWLRAHCEPKESEAA